MLNKTKYIVTMLAAISVGGIAYTQAEGTVLVPYKDSAGGHHWHWCQQFTQRSKGQND